MKIDGISKRLLRQVEGYDKVFYKMMSDSAESRLSHVMRMKYCAISFTTLKYLFHWNRFKFEKELVEVKRKYDKRISLLQNRMEYYWGNEVGSFWSIIKNKKLKNSALKADLAALEVPANFLEGKGHYCQSNKNK